MSQFNLPDDRHIAGKIIDAEMTGKKLDRGWVGYLFGAKDHVPYNIAAVLSVILTAMLGFLFFSEDSASKAEGISTISSILMVIIGYLFGRSTKD